MCVKGAARASLQGIQTLARATTVQGYDEIVHAFGRLWYSSFYDEQHQCSLKMYFDY